MRRLQPIGDFVHTITDVSAPGLCAERLSAASVIFCRSLEMVRCATPRSPSAARHARLATMIACSGPVTSSL